MKIARERYLKRLIARKHDGFVKVITGLRRCGKSYLLLNLFREHLLAEGVDERHIVGIDLDDKENVALRNPHRLFDFIVERAAKGIWSIRRNTTPKMWGCAMLGSISERRKLHILWRMFFTTSWLPVDTMWMSVSWKPSGVIRTGR